MIGGVKVKEYFKNVNRPKMWCLCMMIIGVLLNVLPAYLVWKLKVPLYLDTTGTVLTAALCGAFPGIVTASISNVVAGLFNGVSPYFVIINVCIAICVGWFSRLKKYKKKRMALLLILILAIISGGIGIMFQWLLLDGPQFADVQETAKALFTSDGAGYFMGALCINIGLNFVDKTITTLIALLAIRLMPKQLVQDLWNCSWQQKPLMLPEIRRMNAKSNGKKYTVRKRVTTMLVIVALGLATIIIWISMDLHFKNERERYTQNAHYAARFAASMVDPDRVDDYLEYGESAEGYQQTKDMLYKIRDNSDGVKYLYLVKIKKDGCYFIMDLDSGDMESYQPGEKAEFEEAFEPYLEDLLAGKQIEPIESNDKSGWVLTDYCPVRNSAGVTVCYAGADVAMENLSAYIYEYMIKVILVFSGFFILIMGYGLWTSGNYLVYPIGSMDAVITNFRDDDMTQETLEANVKKLRELDIRTGDEVEHLYNAIYKMAYAMAEQMRDIRHYAQTTADMQNGLIITMADMVENRDSDTGAHIQKTAAYVRIILNGLAEKGYYSSKLTPKYIEDVVMSAPLHDVGKINIPDAVLNKPGKLTDEEFAIMKTHTTAGKKIMEQAISTVKGENYLKEARNMAAYHHERWDGKGYPEGLVGEVIPLSARVMAVADVFDALTSPRVYKPAFPIEKALEIIQEGAGTQFDPKCVEVFMDSLTEVKVILQKYQEA